MTKKVAIIILSYNGSRYLGDCLSSVKKLNYPHELVEIVVVDNASTDGTADWLKAQLAHHSFSEGGGPELKAIFNKQNLGFTGGNNVGLQYAIDNNFGYAYLLNQDTEVEPDFLMKAVAVAESDNNIGAVQSRLMLHGKIDTINSIGNHIHFLGFAYAGGHGTISPKSKVQSPKSITYASGAAMLLKISVLKQIGLFYDEFFMYHEDVDLGWQIWLAGYECWLASQSVVYHKYEFSRSIKKYYYMERNRYLVMLQNYKLATIAVIFPALVLMDCAMFFYSFFSGWWRELFKVYLYFLKPKTWQKIFARRKLVQSRRVVPDKKVIKQFVGEIQFQELPNPLLKYIASPLFNFYWQIIRRIIWW